MTQLTNTPVPIAWEAIGDGPPVLLVQGLGYARWGWEPLIPALAQEFRVISFDNRGIGQSGHPAGPYTAAQMAEDCVSVLDAAGVAKSHVIGTSLGGMIAQELAIGHPERIERLALLSTTPGGPDAYPMPGVTVDLLGQVQQMAPDVALRRLVENAVRDGAAPEIVDRILYFRTSQPQDPAGWQAQAAAGLGYDGGGRASRIEAPTLILHGRDDRVVDPRNAELLGEMIPGSRVEIVSGGHLFFWEDPELAIRLLAAFMSEGR